MDQTNRLDSPLRDVYCAIIRHKWKALASFLAVMIAVTLATVLTPRTYRSEGKLLVRLGRENTRLDPTVSLQPDPMVAVPYSREDEINSVVEILNSRMLAEKVVDALGVATVLGQGSTTSSPGPIARNKAVLRLKKHLSVEPARKSNVARIAYEGQSPELAQAIVAKLIDFFRDEHIRINRTEGAHEFFAEQAARSFEDLTQREEALRNLKNRIGPTSPDGQRTLLVDRIGHLEDELCLTDAARTVSQTKLDLLREKLAALPEIEVTAETSGFNDEGTDRMRDQFYALQLQGQEAAAKYTESHPRMQAIRQQMAEARKTLDEETPKRHQVTKGPGRMFEQTKLDLLNEEPLLGVLKAKAGVLREQLAAVQIELKALNENDLKIATLQREIELCEANYHRYATGREQSRIDQALQNQRMSNIKVVQPATYEIKPIRPRKLVNLLLGLMVGMLGGVGVAMAAEYRDCPLRTPQEVEEHLRLPVLTSLPRFKQEHLTLNGRNRIHD